MTQDSTDTLSAGGPGAKGHQTRRTILDAAIARFGREGFRATSVADIARDASVGGSVAYAYFSNKEALFLAALDEDVAALISVGAGALAESEKMVDWHERLFFTLIGALDEHPLARRMLAGLEPEVTERVLEIPALSELRRMVGERLRAEQVTGSVRSDIDPVAVGNGVVAILLSLLMSVVQIGSDVPATYAADVVAVFRAAIEQSPPRAT